MKINGNFSRRKGMTGEYKFRDWYNKEFNKNIQRCLGQARDSGADFYDFPFMFEVKNCEHPSFSAWWRQVEAAAWDSTFIPVVAWTRNRVGWTFLIPDDAPSNKKGFACISETNFKFWLTAKKANVE